MKVVVINPSGTSIIITDDAADLELTANCFLMDGEKIFGISSINATIYENVNVPPDWKVGKYCFNGSSWEISKSWSEGYDILQE